MIVCSRTVRVPADQRKPFIEWINSNAGLRQQHGILFEYVLQTSPRQNPAKTLRFDPAALDTDELDSDELVVVTGWPDHEAFDTWINTPDRDRLTASDMHRAVEFRPLTRYDLIGGYPVTGTFPI